MRKLNVTDGQTDGGRCNISRPGPPAPREIIKLNIVSHVYQPDAFIKYQISALCGIYGWISKQMPKSK